MPDSNDSDRQLRPRPMSRPRGTNKPGHGGRPGGTNKPGHGSRPGGPISPATAAGLGGTNKPGHDSVPGEPEDIHSGSRTTALPRTGFSTPSG